MSSQLRDEIRQGRPFEGPEQEAFLGVIRTAALLADGLEKVLRPAGITLAQYNVLRILRGSEEGLCRNEVRDRMLTRMPDMTRLLDRMEQAGLVSRNRSTEDRRVVSTHITAAGRTLLDQLAAPVREEHQRRLGHLGPERLNALIALLAEARETFPDQR